MMTTPKTEAGRSFRPMIEKSVEEILSEEYLEMFMNDSMPLVSFCLMCYNQEKYIGDALKAALSQTYPNLEIIVSDDCSSDASWEVLNNISSEYGGKKKIKLYRNSQNLGMGLN